MRSGLETQPPAVERELQPARSGEPRSGPTPLLIVGHGTRSAQGVAQFRHFVQRTGQRLAPRGVTVAGGLIELAPPPIAETVRSLVTVGPASWRPCRSCW